MFPLIDLHDYCAPDNVRLGQEIFQAQGVSRLKTDALSDGTFRTEAKVTDGYNFVCRPWVIRSCSETGLLRSGCSCGHRGCEHLAALLLALPELQIVAAPEKPVPEPIPEPIPAPEPIPEPVRESVPEPEPIPEPVPEPEPIQEPEPLPELPPRSMEIRFGDTLRDEEPIVWYPNDTERVFHPNVGIIGTMGTGKTQFTKSMITQIYRAMSDNYDGSPLGILIFDYKGDYNETKEDFVRAANARVLKPYCLPYNPLALHRTKAFRPLLPVHTANQFNDTISKIYNLGPKQQDLLLKCILEAYERQGIDPGRDSTWDRPAPTFEQVYQVFEAKTDGLPPDSLSSAMNKLHQFRLFEEDPRRACSLDQLLRGVVVVDLSGYDSQIQSLIVAITLDQFYAQMQKNGSSRTDGRFRQIRSLILVDEADAFMRQGFPSLRKIMKEGREAGVGVILSTQSLTHFIGGEDDYSRYVLSWVVHNVSDLKQKDVEYVFKLQPKSPDIMQQYSAIKKLGKHESVVKLANDPPTAIRDLAFWQLYQQLEF